MAVRIILLLDADDEAVSYTVLCRGASGMHDRVQQGRAEIDAAAIQAERTTLTRAIRRALARPDDPRRLAAIHDSGRLLFDLLLPTPIKARLRSMGGGELVLATRGLERMPWQALHDGHHPLGLRWAIGELSLSDRVAPQIKGARASADRLLVVADPAADLPAARYEGEALIQALAGEAGLACDLRVGRLRRADLLRIFKRFSMIHFAGHADPATEERGAGWRLADGWIDAAAIAALAGDTAPSLVFVNACRSAEAVALVDALVDAGVRYVVGAGVDLPDLPGADFAIRFYHHLREGLSVGEALRAARAHAAAAGDPIWAAYRLRGDPGVAYLRSQPARPVGVGARRGVALAILRPIGAGTAERIAEDMQVRRDAERQCITAHGGRLLPGRGAVTRAVFGVPFSHENDVERAADAALALADDQTRIALDLGPMLTQGVDVVGAAALNAEAMCWQHAPGIWPSAAVLRALGARAICDADGRLTCLDAGPARSAHPLIGRRAELDRLARAFDGVAAGASAAVTLVGPAGIGKSHLAETALDQHRARARVVRSIAPRYTDAHPFGAIANVLRALLDVDEDAPAAVVAAALSARIDALDAAAQAQDAFLSIDALLDPTATRDLLRDRQSSLAAALDLPDLVAGIDPRSVAPAVRAFVEACAQDAPLVICFEDAHALCDASLAVVEELIAEAVDAPVLIVCVARPLLLTRAPQWGTFGAHSRLDLGPLPPHEAEAVVRQALPGASKDVVQALTARAAGNPLFLRELGLAHADGDAALPATVGAVMQARIDRLPPATQTILRAAAIFGRSFWAEGVARLAGRRDSLTSVLAALAQARFIEPESPSAITGLAQWRFAQPLMQEVVVAGVGSRAARALHARAALWLSDEVPQRAERLARIARHLDAAGDSARAATLWLQAASQATAAHAPAEAAKAIRAALRADDVAPGALTEVRRAQAEADLAQFAFLHGALDEAAERLDRALAMTLPPLDRAAWLRLRAEIDEARSALPEARARLAEVRTLLTEIDPIASADIRHMVARDEAWLAIRDGAYVQADAILQTAMQTVAPEAQASRGSLSNLLGVAAAGRGEAEVAQAWYRGALEAARAAGDLATVASICLNLGNLAVDHNDYPAGVEWYAQVIRARARQGNRSGLARAYGNLGTVHAMLAEYDKAARYLNEAIRIRARTGHVESAVYAANLGEVYMKQGRLDDAGPHLERAIEQCRSGTAPGYLLPDVLRGLAELRLAQGAIDAAVDAAREALDLADASGDRPHAGVAGRVLGDALARRGDPEAQAVLDAAINTLEALELPLELGIAYATQARHTADGEIAARLTAQARVLLESVSATAELAALPA